MRRAPPPPIEVRCDARPRLGLVLRSVGWARTVTAPEARASGGNPVPGSLRGTAHLWPGVSLSPPSKREEVLAGKPGQQWGVLVTLQ